MPAIDRGVEPVSEREVVIMRVIDAPARLLFKACSTPEHLTRWFGPPGWPLTLCEMDFRAGGRYRFAMTGPDGQQGTPFGGAYLEIVPNRTIVYTGAFETPDAETMTVKITFDEDEQRGQTTLTIHTLFASVAMKHAHLGMGYEQGWGSMLDQFADVVAELRAQEHARRGSSPRAQRRAVVGNASGVSSATSLIPPTRWQERQEREGHEATNVHGRRHGDRLVPGKRQSRNGAGGCRHGDAGGR